MDWQINTKQRLSVRGSGSTWAIPYDGVSGTVFSAGRVRRHANLLCRGGNLDMDSATRPW